MISLARHIETLLLRHDCVVVPGFGGFITNYVEAMQEQHDASMVFFPPYRVVRFNQSLTQNDGLLVGSYMSAYDAAFPAAEKQMQQDVNTMVDRLKLDGRYELENIGTLRMDLNHTVTLETAESGIATPGFYGLSSLHLRSAEAVEAERKLKEAIELTTMVPVVAAPAETEESRGDVTIRIRRRWVDIAISAAAAVLLFFLFSYPMMREPAAGDVVVAGVKTSVTDRPSSPSVSQTTPPSPLSAEEGVKEEETVTDSPSSSEKESGDEVSPFSIVLASYVAEPNALEYVDNLAKAGFKEGRFERTGKVSRVLYGHYTSEKAANDALRQLKEQSKEFAEAWVYEYQ